MTATVRTLPGGTGGPVAGRLLGSGGEAEVFEVAGSPGDALKRYRSPTTERAHKLEVMLANPPSGTDDGGHVAIAWPTALVTEAGQVTGFVMPRIPTRGAVPLFRIYNPVSRRERAPGFTWRYLVRTARNVAAIVASLHRAGYVVGDLNESNFLVGPRALVSLVDCDSLQVTDPADGTVHRCPVSKPEYLPPELAGRDLSRTDRTPENDCFALAVLIHLILMEGQHPFSGRWRGAGDPPDLGERIARRVRPYRSRRLAPTPFALPVEVASPAVARMMRRAFGRGLRRPSVRPTAEDWVEALDQLDESLIRCERSAHHLHFRGLRRCPWCERIGLGLADSFPGPGRTGVEAPPPTALGRVRRRTRSVWSSLRRRLADQARHVVVGSAARLRDGATNRAASAGAVAATTAAAPLLLVALGAIVGARERQRAARLAQFAAVSAGVVMAALTGVVDGVGVAAAARASAACAAAVATWFAFPRDVVPWGGRAWMLALAAGAVAVGASAALDLSALWPVVR